MKTNELMIGDWVMYHKHMPMIIYQLSPDFEDMDDLNPIPLTIEIIEKNGFIEFEDEIFHIKTHRWERWLNDGYLHECVDILRSSDKKGYCIFARHDYNELKLYLHYVHELQHALRLCGIEKEIELND